MKLFIAFAIFVMSWEPSCEPGSSPTGPSQPNKWDTVDPGPQDCASYYGKVVDYSSGQYIQSARICLNGSSCQMAGTSYYQFKTCSSTVPFDVKIKVTHPDYHPDSLMQTITRALGTQRHDFRLRRKMSNSTR